MINAGASLLLPSSFRLVSLLFIGFIFKSSLVFSFAHVIQWPWALSTLWCSDGVQSMNWFLAMFLQPI